MAGCSSHAKCSGEGIAGWGNCDKKFIKAAFRQKKKQHQQHTNITRKEDHTGLKEIYLERSGSKNK
jgi:hypothetical protein